MNKIDLSIIVVGYKSEKTIIPFLDSIQKSPDKLNKEIIYIENYSLDNAAILAEKHPIKPTVIKNTENVGFAKAVNQGLKVSRGDYILLINPDTRIIGNAIKTLFDFAKSHEDLGAVAPKLLDENGKVQPSVYKFPTIINAIRHYFFGNKKAFNKYFPGNKTVKVEIAVMAAFLFPRSTYEKVGGLDESYFLYYEDIEFCRRLFKFKLPIYYFPKAKVKHAHGASGNFKSHKSSPLIQSAKIYHGAIGSFVLNSILWLGQKWQKIRKLRYR